MQGDRINHEPLGLKEKINCFNFYLKSNGINRLHALMPRSGSHWSELGMSLAIDLANGGDGEYTFEKDMFWPRDGLNSRRLDWRLPMGKCEDMYDRPSGPSLGQHLFYHTRNPYFRIRSAQLPNMKIVLQTRPIIVSLESRFFKFCQAKNIPSVTLQNEESFEWQRFLTDAIEFNNSWGNVLNWHPNILHVRYDDLKKDPVAGHKEILSFWGFDIPEECVAEGFRRARPDEMSKRVNSGQRQETYRLPDRTSYPAPVMSKDLMQSIIDRLNKELTHTLGYEYSMNTTYAFEGT